MRNSILRGALLIPAFLALVDFIGAAEVLHFRMADTVQPASRKYIERVLTEAAGRNSDLVVMEIDTPGGLISSSREIP